MDMNVVDNEALAWSKDLFRNGRNTLAKTEIIYPKNVEAQVAIDFT